jgi:dipeptidyl aminopeptidase/acylaminoacyl peptidase
MLAVLAGCTGSAAQPAYSIDNNGVLSVTCGPVTTTEEVLFTNATYTKTKIILHTQSGDVVAYLGAPEHPKAVIVYAPGAGEKITGHEERMVRYAAAGYAFLFVDVRGNRAETPGYAFNPQQDYNLFVKGDWPQYYLTICDLMSARALLAERYGVPVYAVGGSNGGRYAAVAAGVDPKFTGYVGISTSDWGIKDAVTRQVTPDDLRRFATSLEPSTYLKKISPRPVWMFHNATDPIIPFDQGRNLFATAGEPKTFIEFNGDHGINTDVDQRLIMQWAQIYGA